MLVSILENLLYRETWVTRRGDHHVGKRSCDPPPQQRYATGEPGKVQ